MFFPSGNRGLCLLLTLVNLGSLAGFSQPYVFNGNASSVGGGCWQITPPTTGQRGSIWSTSQINLNQPFDITWDLLFGNNNGGADGIVFVLQNTGTNVLGGTGGSLSFAGISPSLGVEFDTWQNATDPAQDHIGIQRDGSTSHSAPNMIAPPVALGNFEDGLYHAVRIAWDPGIQQIRVWYDCTLIITTTYNVLGIFGGNPMVYWGFVGATGGAFNDQRACLRSTLSTNSGSQPICQGSSLTLSANSTSPSGIYNWSPNYNLSGSGASVTVNPAVDTVYTVSYSDACGDAHVDSFAVTINALPTFSLGADTAVCAGHPVTLTPDTQFPGSSLIWSTGASTNSLTVTTPGTYSLILTDANGCQGTDTVVINQLAPPLFSLGPDTSICPGDTAFLMPDTLSAGLTYIWQNLSGDTVFFADTAGIYWLELAATNSCTYRDSIEVFEIQLPVADLGVDVSKCPEDSVLLDATPVGSWPGIGYQWQDNSTNATLWATAPAQYIATLLYQGCSVSDTLLVSDYNVQPTTLPESINICPGEVFTLDAGQPSYTYTWSNGATSGVTMTDSSGGLYWLTFVDPDGCTAADTTLVIENTPPIGQLPTDTAFCLNSSLLLRPDPIGNGSFTTVWDDGSSALNRRVAAAGSYWVQITDADGCVSYDSVNVTTYALPTVTLPDDTLLCEGTMILLDPSVPGWDFVWNTGDSTGLLPVTAPGTYRVTFTDPNGCSNSDQVVVREVPILLVNLGEDREVCGASLPVLDADPSNQYPGVSFLWSTGESSRTIEVEETGLYYVTLSNECFTESDSVNIELKTDIGLWVPNAFTPNGDGLNDEFLIGGLNLTDFQIVIYDRWGIKIFTSGAPDKAWDGTVNGKPLPTGVYPYVIQFSDCAFQPDQRGGTVTLIR